MNEGPREIKCSFNFKPSVLAQVHFESQRNHSASSRRILAQSSCVNTPGALSARETARFKVTDRFTDAPSEWGYPKVKVYKKKT